MKRFADKAMNFFGFRRPATANRDLRPTGAIDGLGKDAKPAPEPIRRDTPNPPQVGSGILGGARDNLPVFHAGDSGTKPDRAQVQGLASPSVFFSKVRKNPFGGRMTQAQVDGCNRVLEAMQGLPVSWVAYALATTYHETAATMQPILEKGGPAYFKRMYDPEGKRPHVARALGNTMPGDGVRFAGRGYVQLTGRTNYERAGKAVGYPLVGNPDLAMRPDIAAEILRCGMIEGWFVPGHTFERHLPTAICTREQFAAARRIINGTDKRDLIAGYALDFQAALIAGGWK